MGEAQKRDLEPHEFVRAAVSSNVEWADTNIVWSKGGIAGSFARSFMYSILPHLQQYGILMVLIIVFFLLWLTSFGKETSLNVFLVIWPLLNVTVLLIPLYSARAELLEQVQPHRIHSATATCGRPEDTTMITAEIQKRKGGFSRLDEVILELKIRNYNQRNFWSKVPEPDSCSWYTIIKQHVAWETKWCSFASGAWAARAVPALMTVPACHAWGDHLVDGVSGALGMSLVLAATVMAPELYACISAGDGDKPVTSFFSMNQVVEGNYQGGGCFCPGKINAVNADGTYDIAYDDGDYETSVRVEDIQTPSDQGDFSHE